MKLQDFLNICNSFNKQGYVYVYGGKFTLITEKFIQNMKKMYPSVYTENYCEKCRNYIGRIGVDCSGLVCHLAELKMMNSSMMEKEFKSKQEPFLGSVAWRSGHVGIVVGIDGNYVEVLEAKGIDYGIVINTYHKNKFNKYLELPTVDYSKEVYKIEFSEDFLKKFCEFLEKEIKLK